mgnify:CR=1 FL=1
MPTIKTIKPAGDGDFTTLALWEDFADGQSSADQWAECYSGGNLGAVEFSGWSSNAPSSSNYPKIFVAEGHKHGADVSSGAYISAATPIKSSVDYLRIDGLRIEGTSDSQKLIDFSPSVNAIDARVDNCFLHGDFQYGIYIGQSASGTNSSNYLTNNIIVIDGTATTTPAGMYIFGTDASGGITSAYVYNNTMYVINAGTLTNYVLRFVNVSGCTLNMTVENNIAIGSAKTSGESITVCYNQIAFHTGSKTFNNNISSDATADDFGGTSNQLNERATNIWQDGDNYNFNLKTNSVAIDFGKTVAAVTTDIVGISRPQPVGGSYDIGALERYIKTEITYGVTPSLVIPNSIISSHERAVDSIISSEIGQVCQLIYPVTKKSVCPNCVYSPRERKSSNIYKSGGPVPFTNHTICPWCGGEGRSSRPVKEDIRVRVYWTQRDWLITVPAEYADSSVMIIGYMTDLPKIEKADRILLNKDVSAYRKWICERNGEAVPWGFSQDRYFSQMLRRVSGG